MTEGEIPTKNLILSTEFDRYILQHPDFAEKIPLYAQVVLLPAGDKELCRLIWRQQNISERKGNKLFIGQIAPQISRLTNGEMVPSLDIIHKIRYISPLFS